jgi:hypothetical protein
MFNFFRNYFVPFCISGIFIVVSGCEKIPPEAQIPNVFVDETINLNNFEYNTLNNIGGYVYLEGGVRGIILYRQSPDVFRAFERNCPYQPMDECANISVDESTFFMIDSCCNSTFDFDGNPTGGPARFPLLEYSVVVNQNFLTITN